MHYCTIIIVVQVYILFGCDDSVHFKIEQEAFKIQTPVACFDQFIYTKRQVADILRSGFSSLKSGRGRVLIYLGSKENYFY